MTKNLPENITRFEAFVREVMEKQSAAGLAVSIVSADGTVLYERCFGSRDLAQNLPMTPDTIMGIASMSKSFCALSIMQLYERGIIDIDAPVKQYLPAFRDPDVLVRHFLSHIAGYYPLYRKDVRKTMAEVGLPEGADPFQSPEVAAAGLTEVIEDMNAQTLRTGRPGENFSYCNDGFALLSELVRLYGGEETYGAYLQKNVLAPLGMADTGARLVFDGEMAGRVSRLYQRGENGAMSGDWTPFDDQQAHAGAGGLRSTLEDMKKYVLMYLNGGVGPSGARVLSSHGIREMMRPRVKSELNGYYGYGLYSRALGNMTVWGHGGDQPGVAAHMDWSAESGVGVVVLCNTSQVASEAIARKAILLASGYDFEESEAGLEPVEWTDEQMDAVCGRYHSGEGTDLVIERTGSSFRVILDGAETIAYPVNCYMLRVKYIVDDIYGSLYRDDDGKVYALGGGFRMLPKVE